MKPRSDLVGILRKQLVGVGATAKQSWENSMCLLFSLCSGFRAGSVSKKDWISSKEARPLRLGFYESRIRDNGRVVPGRWAAKDVLWKQIRITAEKRVETSDVGWKGILRFSFIFVWK